MSSKPGMSDHESSFGPTGATLTARPLDEGRPALLDGLRQDLRYAVRTLRRDAGFTWFATLIVGLGIGASATVFSVANAVIIRPLPFRDPAQLAWITNRNSSGLSGQTTQVANFLDLRDRNGSFSDVAGYFAFYGVGDSKLTGNGPPERLSAVPVSQNFFPLLGVEPALGRYFTADECRNNGPRVVMLSHNVWQRRFASDPSIVGRALTLNDQAVTVVAVLPPTFDFSSVFAPASHIDLFVPFPLTPETSRMGNTLAIVARLKPGVPVERAASEVRALGQQITREHPDRNSFEGNLVPLAAHVSGGTRPALVVLGCAVGVVMLIVCANLSSLLLGSIGDAAEGDGDPRGARSRTRASPPPDADREPGAVLLRRGAWHRGRVRRDPRARAPRRRQYPSPAKRPAGFHGTRVHGRDGTRCRPRVRNGARAPGCGASASGVAEGIGARLERARGRKWIRTLLVVSEITFACVLLVGAGLLMRSLLRSSMSTSGSARAHRGHARRSGCTARHAGGAERLLRRCVAARSRSPRHRWRRVD